MDFLKGKHRNKPRSEPLKGGGSSKSKRNMAGKAVARSPAGMKGIVTPKAKPNEKQRGWQETEDTKQDFHDAVCLLA